jgi:uncharacterized protein
MEFLDTLTLDGPRRTQDGYLVASVKVARTGIQIYSGREVDPENKQGMRDRAEVRIFRPEAEVFSKDALASFAHRPVTVNHPSEAVTADNWRKYSVGMTGDEIARDGETVRVPMVVMDAAAIRAIESGKRQISQGYNCDLVWENGVTTDGLEYDAKQTNIRGNHTAIVDMARGGPELKIGDEKPMKTILIDGHSVEVSDAAEIAIKVVTDRLAAADAKVATLTSDKGASDNKVVELTAQIVTKDAEIVTLKKQVDDAKVTPEKLRDAAKAYATTMAVAKQIAPTAAISDTMDEAGIKRVVVSTRMGDAAKDYTDDHVSIAFETLKAALPAANGMRDAIRTVPQVQAQTADSKAAYKKMVDDMTNPEPEKKAS